MSFNSIKNAGLVLLVLILLLFAALTRLEGNMYRSSIDKMENVHHPQLHRITRMGNLLNSAEINFEVYSRREVVRLETNNELIGRFDEKIIKLKSSLNEKNALTLSAIEKNHQSVKVTWNRLKMLWTQNKDLASDDLQIWAEALNVSLLDINWLLIELRNNSTSTLAAEQIATALSIVKLIGGELDAFLTQEPIFIDGVLQPLNEVKVLISEIAEDKKLAELETFIANNADNFSANPHGSHGNHEADHDQPGSIPDLSQNEMDEAHTAELHTDDEMPMHESHDAAQISEHDNPEHESVSANAQIDSTSKNSQTIQQLTNRTVEKIQYLEGVLKTIDNDKADRSETHQGSTMLARKLINEVKESVIDIEQKLGSILNLENQIIFHRLDRYQNFKNVMTVLGCLLALFISLFMSMRLNKQVTLVTNGTTLLSEGNLDHRIPTRSNDQLGEIAIAFNLMADKLRARDHERDTLMHEIDRSAKEAESASAAKGQFMASMSHEIRTPINGVLGTVDLLMREPLSRSQMQLTETIHRSGNTLLGIINDILDHSKIEAGSLELDEQPFDLTELIEDIGELSAPAAHNKNLEINYFVNINTDRQLVGDALRIRQILTNLVSNAIKFTDKGEITIVAESTSTEIHTVRLKIDVSDTGIGINEEEQSRIFQEFTQASRSTTRKYGGTGLGLAISRQLTEMMEGELVLSSEPGVGSTFSWTVELSVTDTKNKPTFYSGDFTAVNVAIASNHSLTRKSISSELNRLNIEPVEVETVYKALDYMEKASAEDSNLIIVDRELADTSGLEFIRILQDKEELKNRFNIVKLCRVDEPAIIVNEMKELGVSHTIKKPVRQSAMYNCLLEHTGVKTNTVNQQQSSQTNKNLNANVLLVEDHPTNQDIISRMLIILGCEVTLAENGLIAFETMQKNRYDIVLMDCDMPVMDGFTATREYRKYEQSQSSQIKMPIVALTANALQGDRKRCLDAGMDDYATKPLTIDGLEQVISEWAQKTNDRAADETTANTIQLSSHTSANNASQDLLDLDIVNQIISMDTVESTSFLNELLTNFSTNWEKDSLSLNNALQLSEQEQARKMAHRLKSASGTMGAVQLASLASEIELAAKEGDLTACKQAAIKLPDAYNSTMTAFSTFLNSAA